MQLEIRRRIRDNLNGSVDLSSLEDEVIAHPQFQRLRRIRQTAFLYLIYPGSSHSRFEHSLGVMHLAGLAWAKIKDNQIRIKNTCQTYNHFTVREQKRREGELVHGLLAPTFPIIDRVFSSPYILQAIRLAALLHDVGHPPFSHTGERLLPSWNAVLTSNPKLPPYLKEFISRKASSPEHQDGRVRHEIYTVILIDYILSDIYSRHSNLFPKIEAQDLASMILPEIPPKPGSELLALDVHRLCHELISGEIDIDRMDYLRRDARECGVTYGLFDVDRILDSLTIYESPEDHRLHLAIQYSGLPAFEDYLRARQSMYAQLYFHKTSTACEAMMQNLTKKLGPWHLPAEAESYGKMDEYQIHPCLLTAGRESVAQEDYYKFKQLLDDLLLNRRLWKMIYEITVENGDKLSTHKDIKLIQELLFKEKIENELISSHNVLSKFQGRKKGQKSQNNLRLIKKDTEQFPRVEAIEDYFSAAKEGGMLSHRIYVSRDDAKRAEKIVKDLLDARDPFASS